MMFTYRNFLTICVCCVIFQSSYGGKSHKHTFYETNDLLDGSKFVEKKKYHESSSNDERPQTAQLLKMGMDVSKKLTPSENENSPSKADAADYKTLETKVGDYLVKVKSKKESESLNSAPVSSYINPKYSHIIEIIHRGDNLENQNNPAQFYGATEEKHDVEIMKNTTTGKVVESEYSENLKENMDIHSEKRDPEELGDADEGDYQEYEKTEASCEANENTLDEFNECEENFVESHETNSDLKKFEANERNPVKFEDNLVDSTNIKGEPEDIFTDISDIKIPEESHNAKKNGIRNEQTSNNQEGSAFNEEFEGSGEEFADVNDRNTTKSGRIILGMFSRQNETFPVCITPKGEKGRCLRLGGCLVSEFINNFNGFLRQMCIIRSALVGICCPDNPVIETVNPDANQTSELISVEIKQPPEGCGLNTKTRIVGGTISVPHEWTWMVALMRRNRFYCGGVIINNWYILTAAHCVMGMNVKDLTVRLGEYDFSEKGKHTEDLSVAEIKRHAQFITLTFQHDIALLKLKRSIKYSKFVGSICLPEEKARDYSDAKGTVVGWGTVSFGGAASPVLRQVTVPVWPNEKCDKTYVLENIGDSFLCAGSPDKGLDACQGDSGGPLMTVNENGRWEVIGLVSWGRRCGDPTYPGVYTRITTYLDWIKQNAV